MNKKRLNKEKGMSTIKSLYKSTWQNLQLTVPEPLRKLVKNGSNKQQSRGEDVPLDWSSNRGEAIDEGEDIIKSLMPAPSMIKRICFAEGKKLKPSIDKSYRGEERSLEGAGVILIKIMKMCVLVLIKDLIISGIISFK